MFVVTCYAERTEGAFGKTDVSVSDIMPGFPVSPSKKGLTIWIPLRKVCAVNFAFNNDVDVKGQSSLFAFSLFLSPQPFPSIL